VIRFIDMRSSRVTEADPCFAFWNTVVDRFVEFDDEQAWRTFDEMLECASAQPGVSDAMLVRLKSLCAPWALKRQSDGGGT